MPLIWCRQMILKSFRVRLFRNIIDSGDIDVVGNTCLVGKNEAGKSAVIEALHRLNPARPVKLDLLEEYPRWLKKSHEISGEIANAVPISAVFDLSDDDVRLVEEKFGPVLSSNQVVVFRKYHGDFSIQPNLNFESYIREFIKTKVSELLGPSLAVSTTTDDLRKHIDQIANKAGDPTPEVLAAKQALQALDEQLGSKKNLTSAVTDALTPRVPKTFYFSQYSQLRGRYELDEVLAAVKKGSTDEEVQAAADFLALARITPGNVQSWDFEASNAELESVSSLLSQRVKANWKQNQHLKLVVKIESIPDAPNQPKRYLQFRVEDTRHDFTSRLDRRSTGFRWFVSFVASFFEFEKDGSVVLLLDEPGLSLHARAQKDLLDAIDRHLAGSRQVIYTTHSPFMVRTEALERVRIVEDKGPERGSVVTNDAGVTSDPDTLFPLQAALGYDIAQNLFIGNQNILLEGTSDFVYLTIFSSYLARANRASLPENCRLLPAGGATNIPTFLALLGGDLDVVVLLDGNAQRQKIDNVIAAGRLNASRVLSIDNFCTVQGADIEDLFSPAEYLQLYNATYGASLDESDLTGDDRIVKRIRRKIGHEFDHGRVAGHFLLNQEKALGALATTTIARFEALIAALVKALPPIP
jgi:hypothetical protein